ncbi:hypothetical protein Atc_1930 [Acidithiobacillus caldus SM-1]|uniref:Uncharacterized protein n=1 Tax=Acidithiobacillus caldus (strain SM-1) TaxID=990288 RepID=F9ZQ60_ACICS|nr:hypothetical protein Atc_1930 [Acidithiobacillus caldus SM-1]QER43200.1 hypothetical protein F0726_00108 [Acidithiobacillus caldus]
MLQSLRSGSLCEFRRALLFVHGRLGL